MNVFLAFALYLYIFTYSFRANFNKMESAKQKQIRKTGRKLFWKYGIRRITIEEICEDANVSKGTFYKYFKNKDELLKYLLDFMYADALTAYNQIMDQNIPFNEKIEQIIQMKLEFANEMSIEFFEDFYKNAAPEIQQYLAKHVEENLHIFLDDIVKAQKRGDVRKDLNPQFMIYFINHMTNMMKDDHLLTMYKNHEALAKELVQFFFYGIMPKK